MIYNWRMKDRSIIGVMNPTATQSVKREPYHMDCPGILHDIGGQILSRMCKKGLVWDRRNTNTVQALYYKWLTKVELY